MRLIDCSVKGFSCSLFMGCWISLLVEGSSFITGVSGSCGGTSSSFTVVAPDGALESDGVSISRFSSSSVREALLSLVG